MLIGCSNNTPSTLTLRFHPYVGDTPLALNTGSYQNPGGEGKFSVRDFQVFISNVVLHFQTEKERENESYHLARFDGNEPHYQFTVPITNKESVSSVSFGIGVDPKANGTITIAGDLDPNSRMAWNWEVGYKFLLVEGTLTTTKKQLPLVYHIGFDKSYTRVKFTLDSKFQENKEIVNFKVDLLALFDNLEDNAQQSKPIDMASLSHVKFAPDDVAKIADNFSRFITLMP